MYAIVAAAAKTARASVPKTIPSSSFSDGMVKDFETFAGEVEKELNLSGLGCITGVKGRGAGKKKSRPRPRAPSRSRSPSPSSGRPRKKKKAPPPKKKKKSNAGGNLFSDWTAEDFAGGVNGPSAPPRRRR